MSSASRNAAALVRRSATIPAMTLPNPETTATSTRIPVRAPSPMSNLSLIRGACVTIAANTRPCKANPAATAMRVRLRVVTSTS